jgi:hypothetical protein
MKSPLFLPTLFLSAILCTCSCLCGPAASAAPEPASGAAGSERSSDVTVPAASPSAETTVPGPLRSLLRMAAISQQVSPAEVLPLLARSVVTIGYQGSQKDSGRPTEYLILLERYLQEARQLQTLAGKDGVIRVTTCSDAAPLLTILGYRLEKTCGPKSYLETADPSKAFVTIDSGFPLTQLEEALRTGEPFNYPYAASRVPVLIGEDAWIGLEKNQANGGEASDLIDALVHDPKLSRLYWALAQMDTETRDTLNETLGLKKLAPLAGALDFYGNNICIRSGRVIVPGGAAAEAGWKELVGASPNSPGEFVSHLFARDNGWLAAYYDALSRGNETQQAYFTGPTRMRRFSEALGERGPTVSAFRGAYRPDAGLLLLVTQIQLEPNGQPSVPGDLEAWKDVLRHNTESDPKIVGQWTKRADHWAEPDDLVEAMFGLSRVSTMNSPLQIYLTLTEIDRGRTPEQRLTPDTVRLLGDNFSRFRSQYLTFSEFRGLSNASIADFMKVAEGLDRISDDTVRGNAIGTFQADVGLWQILARQGQISNAILNDSWQRMINPFAGVASPQQLFDAGRASLSALLRDAAGKPDLSQDEIVALLAGPQQSSPEGQQVRREMAERIDAVLDAQRLVSLDTILALGDGLDRLAKDKTVGASLLPLAARLRDFEMPQQILTANEKNDFTAGSYDPRHTKMQMRTDLTKAIQSGSPQELAAAHAALAPFLRDTLVGLNYAYYEPPGAQILHIDPLFVRSHEFVRNTATGMEPDWQTAELSGRGLSAVGGAHLIGSLADLPFALATAEQDFIVPENVQALIWEDLVPSMMDSAVLPRWWNVTPAELHAVALYQRSGEELLSAAATNDDLRNRVMTILSDCMLSQRSEKVENDLRTGLPAAALAEVLPAETFYLAAEYRQRYSADADRWGPAGKELQQLSISDPAEVGWERLSEDFGIPHPALAQSYTRELLNVKLLPTFESYSSRLMAETWESNNLYWARLSDELGYSPVMLNRLVPELTRRMVEKIFATHYEDWPAVLRAMRETGEEFRQGKIVPLPKSAAVSELQTIGDQSQNAKNP